MGQHLVLTVHLYDRFHGTAEGGSEWPPAPGRLFQAIVAGAARGRTMPAEARAALEWLEALPPPVIGAPRARLGERVVLFVPNNDADALSDPAELSSIRTKKIVQPRIPETGPLLYAWPIQVDSHGHAAWITEAANDVYQLGRGIDMAWAHGELLDDDGLSERLARFEGEVYRPGAGRQGVLACPIRGTLRSLVTRHAAPRLTAEGEAKKAKTYFTNAPKPFFVGVAYVPSVHRILFDLRHSDASERFAPERASEVVRLVEQVRDAAVARLTLSMADQAEAITQCLVGKKPHDTTSAKPEHRVRIVPLLSIGHAHADRSVRRVLVEVPSGARLQPADVAWAFEGLEVVNHSTGEIRMVLAPSEDWEMLRRHYLPKARRWRSVTPVALPEGAGRRRIEPTRRRDEAKGGAERKQEEDAAARAVVTALRHAGVQARAASIQVQREPFNSKGQRAEVFEHKPRFLKERLWHVEIVFGESVQGPLVIGDGRFLGLGLMAPVRDVVPGVHAFEIADGLVGEPDPLGLTRALRRAVMARVQDTVGAKVPLDPFFSGHSRDGGPIQRSQSPHLSFAFEPNARRLLILAPHVVERRAPTPKELGHLRTLDEALEGFGELRAGKAGGLRLVSISGVEDDHSVQVHSRVWRTVTSYVVTRHAKTTTAAEAVAADVHVECRRLGLPLPRVESRNVRGVPGVGLTGDVSLWFDRPVAGPLLLGRNRYLGGGLFRAVEESGRE